ncbi:MAG: hypothetical protein A2086_01850 [Spirochaetes bacterium GWD1_27_9]|nr:MAG: hypothetical protein A2Z98_08020 [Spirochaetes bacterium GWB1_27_13]OHD25671.1 MAG: hypothetical protein A2Y34_02195 [Spirochaetes bacterium GWC1_27_15]OHD41627.1 MAG: hypothetical protein A2086_01850 [Spirochaetes bacterium GWD1_27_9]
MPALKKEKYTYGDYVSWETDERFELIDGVVYNLAAPSKEHQDASRELLTEFNIYLRGKKCIVYNAPFDVRLPKGNEVDDDVDTVVQPDLAVICDKTKLDKAGCRGAPDLIVEIVSQDVSRDLKDKFFLYEKHKVKEYWVVHPVDKTVIVFKTGNNNQYGRPDIYSSKDTIKVGIFPDLEIDLNKVFIE